MYSETLVSNIFNYPILFRLEKGENLNAEAVYKAFEEMDLDCSKSLDWTEFVVSHLCK